MQILKENPEKGYFIVKLNATDKFNMMDQMADVLCETGYVKESYKQAVKDREKVFPTGLPFEAYGVAIPHTDIEHVNKKCVMLALLEKPVEFVIMATDDDVCEVEAAFMLALMEPHAQLEMLQNLIMVCQDVDILNTIKDPDNNLDQIIEIMDGLMA